MMMMPPLQCLARKSASLLIAAWSWCSAMNGRTCSRRSMFPSLETAHRPLLRRRALGACATLLLTHRPGPHRPGAGALRLLLLDRLLPPLLGRLLGQLFGPLGRDRPGRDHEAARLPLHVLPVEAVLFLLARLDADQVLVELGLRALRLALAVPLPLTQLLPAGPALVLEQGVLPRRQVPFGAAGCVLAGVVLQDRLLKPGQRGVLVQGVTRNDLHALRPHADHDPVVAD